MSECSSNRTHCTLQVILCGAFYPNYFFKARNDVKEGYRMLSGKNHFNTVKVLLSAFLTLELVWLI